MGEWANGRVGEWGDANAPDAVGRRTRRAEDVIAPTDKSAPVLSRSVDVASGWARKSPLVQSGVKHLSIGVARPRRGSKPARNDLNG